MPRPRVASPTTICEWAPSSQDGSVDGSSSSRARFPTEHAGVDAEGSRGDRATRAPPSGARRARSNGGRARRDHRLFCGARRGPDRRRPADDARRPDGSAAARRRARAIAVVDRRAQGRPRARRRPVRGPGDHRRWRAMTQWLSAAQTAAQIASGELTAFRAVDTLLARIANLDRELGAFLALDPSSRELANGIDQKRKAGEPLGPLAGVPIALKDNLVTRGVATTAASKILAGWLPPYDATVVEKLRAAGAIVLGKLNC